MHEINHRMELNVGDCNVFIMHCLDEVSNVQRLVYAYCACTQIHRCSLASYDTQSICRLQAVKLNCRLYKHDLLQNVCMLQCS